MEGNPNFSAEEKSLLRYRTFVAQKNKLLYTETPKAGCTTIKKFMYVLENVKIPHHPITNLEDVHIRNSDSLPSLINLYEDGSSSQRSLEGFYKFAVVRNPYSRLVSAFLQKIWTGDGYFDLLRGEVSAHSNQKDPNFNDFVQWVINQDVMSLDPHWSVMRFHIFYDKIKYDKVYHIEEFPDNLISDLVEFGVKENLTFDILKKKENKSLDIDWRDFYNDEIALKIYTYYRDDFDTFDYDPDSWIKNVKKEHIFTNSLPELLWVRSISLKLNKVTDQFRVTRDDYEASLSKAKVEAAQIRMELEQTKVEAAQIRMELEQTKVEAAQIRMKLEQSARNLFAIENSTTWKLFSLYRKIRKFIGRKS